MAKSARKFYRTVIQVEVLSEEPLDTSDLGLRDIAYAIDEGDCSGQVTEQVTNQKVDGREMAKLLQKQGSDPEFFRLTEDGEDVDD